MFLMSGALAFALALRENFSSEEVKLSQMTSCIFLSGAFA
jgi:hypothetical protein